MMATHRIQHAAALPYNHIGGPFFSCLISPIELATFSTFGTGVGGGPDI